MLRSKTGIERATVTAGVAGNIYIGGAAIGRGNGLLRGAILRHWHILAVDCYMHGRVVGVASACISVGLG